MFLILLQLVRNVFPKELSAFQRFNLSMVKANARNVSKGVAIRDASRFIFNARHLGFKIEYISKIDKSTY